LERHSCESSSTAQNSIGIHLVVYTHNRCVVSRLALNNPLMTTVKHALADCSTAELYAQSKAPFSPYQ